jgi:hypothetical protein
VVTGRDPLWLPPDDRPVLVGLSSDHREAIVTFITDGSPDHKQVMPQPSAWPFLTAVAASVMFIWSIFSPWGVVWGSIPVAIALVGWFWPKSPPTRDERAARAMPSESRA